VSPLQYTYASVRPSLSPGSVVCKYRVSSRRIFLAGSLQRLTAPLSTVSKDLRIKVGCAVIQGLAAWRLLSVMSLITKWFVHANGSLWPMLRVASSSWSASFAFGIIHACCEQR
jgi:hypothetical protein